MMKFPFKLSMLLLFLYFFPFRISAQEGHADIFKNKDYINAAQWLRNNKDIYDSLSTYGVPPKEAIAIVFPELMRYSALEDKMEVTGLMVLYTRLGKDYADFSVGRFQMKPSFVRQLETDARTYLSPQEIRHICPFLLDGKDTEDNRKNRVNSLTVTNDEVSYLALFYKICLRRFNHVHFTSEAKRISFLATAYNCGYHHAAINLFNQLKEKQFPLYNGLLISHVNYASLSLAWWKRNM